jgi:ribosomal protein S18 acetylase RimI-like enzyme
MTAPNATTIRKASVSDLDRIHEIAVAAWTPIYDSCLRILGDAIFSDMFSGWYLNWCRFKKEHVEDPARSRVIVTELDGQVVGFATWHPLNPKAGEVSGNAVDPKFQGRGFGSRQVKKVIEYIKAEGAQAAYVLTWLDPTHAPARAQYRAGGLTRPIPMAWYMNSLHAVANDPIRPRLKVTPATPECKAALMEIIGAVWEPIADENSRRTGGVYALCYPDLINKKKEDVCKRLAEKPETLSVVLDGGRPVGFCLLDLDEPKKCGSISSLGVLPSARGRGAATALCMEAFRAFRERGLRHARMIVGHGEDTESTRCFCNTVGLHRQIPIVGLFGPLSSV